MERSLLVTVKFDSDKDRWYIKDIANELGELAKSTGAEIIDQVICRPDKPTANLFIGQGKAQEIASLVQEKQIDTVIFSQDFSSTQQRNLEEIINAKTIDRTQLILDIFSRRAKSPEGKMQVELAQLEYLLPRLAGKGIVLSRLGGGIGTRGPGEQKLEMDRRRIREKINRLKNDLKRFSEHRQNLKKKRKENAIPGVAIVGYTSAGKSTLLNTLASSQQIISSALFTTLDPLSKAIILPNGEHVVVSDTVGFLHNLGHHLIEAFKATLEEVIDADLLIHVLDVSHPLIYEHNASVFEVLRDLKADQKPMITALNKIDLLEDKIWLEKLKNDFINPVAISAKLKQNINSLLSEIEKKFVARMISVELVLDNSRMDLIDLFHRQGRVDEVNYLEKGIKIKANLPKILFQKLLHSNQIKEVFNS
ncbi:MAG: GTPase HflX [Candidatus Omnitrophota bacterium]